MSGGHFNYLAHKIENELFKGASVHYSKLDNHYECVTARVDNPMYDEDTSELLFDIACLLHSLEWYESGDINFDIYNKHLEQFKTKWLTRNEELSRTQKALELACIDIASSHPILSSLGFDFYNDRYMKKAREE